MALSSSQDADATCHTAGGRWQPVYGKWHLAPAVIHPQGQLGGFASTHTQLKDWLYSSRPLLPASAQTTGMAVVSAAAAVDAAEAMAIRTPSAALCAALFTALHPLHPLHPLHNAGPL